MSGNLMFREVEKVEVRRSVTESDSETETETETQRGDWIIQTFAILLVSVPLLVCIWLANR